MTDIICFFRLLLVSSSIGITDRSLSDEVQTNKSLLSRISTSENLSTSEHLNQKQQDSQNLNRIE
ncbi:hypothetical protein PSTG_04577 [Puccinia striiformis f. sp. tritici PST-78]|uniref:Uncharacterized protein n=1 Tax=Puccinia striiformis f. sp. tritici PST-78 TaxID=1165861 RepID=A0A0L0VS33_9BASI|nr:hypothetical protein PSTG_04577 [Puccinia striiformis f. sp. tritici PST-78]